MLYEAEGHELLTASAWNEQAARACINEILTTPSTSSRLATSGLLIRSTVSRRTPAGISTSARPAQSGRCVI